MSQKLNSSGRKRWHFLTGVCGLQTLAPRGLGGLAMGPLFSQGATRPSGLPTSSPGCAPQAHSFPPTRKAGTSRPVLSTQKPKGKVLLSLQGFLQHAAWEERPVLGECCCPGCLELWSVCRAGCDPVHFFGLWPESLPVCFTNSYLESQIRLLKSQLPIGL